MNNLDILKTYSIEDMVKKTHLDERDIKAIINKDFEKLKNTNIKMNLRILEREYNVNFDTWMEEYLSFKKEHYEEKEDSFKVKPKLVGDDESKEYSRSSFGLIKIFALLICVIAAIFVYKVYFHDNEVIENNNVEVVEVKNEIPEEDIKTSIQKAKDKFIENEGIKEENSKTEESKAKEEEKRVEQEKTFNEEERKEQEISNAIDEEKKEEVQEEVKKVQLDHKLYLKPSRKLWLSVKDLKTQQEKASTIEKAMTFTQDTLVFLAHNKYILELDGKPVLPNGKEYGRYFIFKNGEVKFLTQEEYRKINKKR